uniref:STAS domain-containing protein n=1 Tax=Elaeophora elaphi TaxID=1147741 RepID=A0A0R3RHU4_9BILA
MADQNKRVNRRISRMNAKIGAVMEKAEGHLLTAKTKASKSKKLPSESSVTDSTMRSSDTTNLKRKMTKYAKIGNHLIKEDLTQSQKSQLKTFREQEVKTAKQKSETQLTLKTERKPAINQEQFDKKHGYRRTNLSLARKIIYQLKIIRTWRSLEWMNFLKSRLPIIGWLPTYNWQEDLLRDIINGIMISIIYIPQGLAYGLMVGTPPIYGIYTGIVGPLIYVFLGTSRHASTGAFAIISMMVGSVIEQSINELPPTHNETDRLCCAKITQKPDEERAVQLASLIAFLVGVIQVILGLLNAGLLAVWLSDQLVEGLTSGAAVHVLASQLQTMTGVENVPHTSEMFGIVRVTFTICFLRNIRTLQLHTFLCTAICILCLLTSKFVIDPVVKPWTKTKFPMEFILVIFSISLCYFANGTPLDLHLHIVGDVDAGMRAPFLPDFGETGQIIFSAFSIAIVSFVIHISLAKLIAKEYKYQISVNQEWLALGSMHILASFFGCFAGGSSLSRTITSAKLGTKSQLTTLVVVAVLLIVAFGAAPLFKYLPKTVLSCIVVVALKELYLKVCWSRVLFKESIVDFFIFLVTFTAVVLINVNIGLAIGVVFALLTVVLRSQWHQVIFQLRAESTCMGRIPGTSDFKGIGHYRAAMEISGIKVFRFDAPLYFANAELFLSSIHSATGLDPLNIVAKLKQTVNEKKKVTDDTVKKRNETAYGDEEIQLTVRRHCIHPSKRSVERTEEAEDLIQLTHIIVDCSSFPYIDLMGVDALARAHAEYKSINITVFFACCKVAVRQMFENSHFYEHVPKSYMFVSLQDAVAQAQYEQQQHVRFVSDVETVPSKIMVCLLNIHFQER